jgi:hypothetical protein
MPRLSGSNIEEYCQLTIIMTQSPEPNDHDPYVGVDGLDQLVGHIDAAENRLSARIDKLGTQMDKRFDSGDVKLDIIMRHIALKIARA